MKKAVRYLLIGLGALAGGSVTAFSINKYSSNKKMNAGGKALFIGDSMTISPTSYADQLNKIIPTLKIKKVAKGGMRTDWMLENAKNDLMSGNYNAVFVLGGTNDVYSMVTVEKMKKNLEAIYDLAKSHGAKIYAITIPPSENYSLYKTSYGQRADELNKWINGNKKSDAVIDFNKMLKSGTGQNKSLFASDMIHPNANGHKVLAEYIKGNIIK